ncbi:MAG: hypothetical protein AAGK00_11505 [Pseudomonadota bacterium]
MTTMAMIARARQELPAVYSAHWLLRLPLAAIILLQGYDKVPLSADDAAAFGVPVLLWAMAAFGEILAGLLLIAGAFVRTWIGDLMTRAAGAMIAAIVAGVLVTVYWQPLIDMVLYQQFHMLLLVGGLFFALRGNKA